MFLLFSKEYWYMIFKPFGKGGWLDQGYLMVLFIQGRKKPRSDCPVQVNFDLGQVKIDVWWPSGQVKSASKSVWKRQLDRNLLTTEKMSETVIWKHEWIFYSSNHHNYWSCLGPGSAVGKSTKNELKTDSIKQAKTPSPDYRSARFFGQFFLLSWFFFFTFFPHSRAWFQAVLVKCGLLCVWHSV